MYFTTLNSHDDIMNYPNMKNWVKFLFLSETRGFFKEKFSYMPLRAAAFLQKTPWGDDLRGTSDQLVDTANLVLEILAGERKCLRLSDWSDFVPDDSSEVSSNENTFLITPRIMGRKKRPTVIICPGGAYCCVSFQNEGTPMQRFLEMKGFAPFVLNYSVSPATYPLPQMDLLKSCQYVKEHADEYDADPERIIFAGFSAGGHLAASAAGLADELLPGTKPQGVFLGYPVISLKDSVTHRESCDNLLKDVPDRERMINKLSVENIVDENYPPTYAFHCSDDECVPAENTQFLADALDINGVKHLCEIFPTGNHGIGLGFGTSAYPWSERMLDFFDMIFR